MATDVSSGNDLEVTCPHCHKPFTPAALARPSARSRGSKCPHCRLFVPLERISDTPLSRDTSTPR
ncbi:MAG: hypothetical protein H0T13_07740 [Actinobacteria bacterium]|nr:hypothetical protein [Actinomycetota bacterium]